MFSKAASQELRTNFWISFGKSFPRKWILYKTDIKGLKLKFHFDTSHATVSLEIDAELEQRIALWGKLTALKELLLTDYLPNALFTETYFLDNKKEISCVHVEKPAVSIHNKNMWQETMVFLNDSMIKFEIFFREYEDYLR